MSFIQRSGIKAVVVTCIILCNYINGIAQDSGLIVIGNAKSVPSELKMSQLRSILRGERMRWQDDTKVIIALMKTNTPVGTITCKTVYNMTGNELNKYWLALVFQGKAEAPVFFNSAGELEVFVSQTPGAIGVLGQTSGLTKIIIIDGKKTI